MASTDPAGKVALVAELRASARPRPASRRRPHPRIDQTKRTWYFFRRSTLAMIGLGIITFFVLVALYGYFYPASTTQLETYCVSEGAPPGNCLPGSPIICTYYQGTVAPGPDCYPTSTTFPGFIAPTITLVPFSLGPLPLGAMVLHSGDQYVYNLYSGLLKGSDWSLSMSVAIVASGAILGLFLGAVSGFYGRIVDEVLMRLTDIFLSVPQFLLVIVTVIAANQLGVTGFNDRILVVVGAFVVTWWPTYARIVRGQVLVVREQKYVEAARASGAGNWRLIRRHVLPNSLYAVFVQMSLDVGTVPLLLAAIVFLGFPILPSYMPEWGSIAAISTAALPGILSTCNIGVCMIPWWQILFPGLALFLFAISVNFVADGLRDALDPRLRR